jgi:hypothetical protein
VSFTKARPVIDEVNKIYFSVEKAVNFKAKKNGTKRVVILTGNESLRSGGGLFSQNIYDDIKDINQDAKKPEGWCQSYESKANESLSYIVVCPPNYNTYGMSRGLKNLEDSKKAHDALTGDEKLLFFQALKNNEFNEFNENEETHRLALAKFLLKKSYKNAILEAMKVEGVEEVLVPEISGGSFGMKDYSKGIFFEAIDELMGEYKNKNDKFDVSRIVVFNKDDDNFQEWTKAKKEYDIKKKSVALSNSGTNLVSTGVSHLFDSRELHGDAVGWVHDSNSESNKYTKIFDVNSFVSSEEDSEDEEGLEEEVVTVIVTAEVDKTNGDIKLHSENMEATVLAALELMEKDKSLVPDMASLDEEDKKGYLLALNSLKENRILEGSVVSRFQKAFGISAESQSGVSDRGSRQFVPTISHSGPTVLDEIKKCIKKGMESDKLNSVYAVKLATSLGNNKPEDDVRSLKDFLGENPEYAAKLEKECNLEKDFFKTYFGVGSVSRDAQLEGASGDESAVGTHMSTECAKITGVEFKVLSLMDIDVNGGGEKIKIKINIINADSSDKNISFGDSEDNNVFQINLFYSGENHYELIIDGGLLENDADGRCGYLSVAAGILYNLNVTLNRENVSVLANKIRKQCMAVIEESEDYKKQLSIELLKDKGGGIAFDIGMAVNACIKPSNRLAVDNVDSSCGFTRQ